MKRSPTRPTIRVGCSGWQYRHWRDGLYAGVPSSRWFERYAEVFDTVELNGTFYRLPEKETVRAWRARAPAGFLFAWKASRFITHMKKLKDPEEPIARMMDRARALGPKLGPILFQLPPGWPLDLPRFRAFLAALPERLGCVFEVREPSWYCRDVYRALEAHGAAMCVHDMPGSASPREAIGPFVYLRLHGADVKYRSGYPRSALAQWAEWLESERAKGKPAFVYFNNDAEGHAPVDARQLRDLLTPRPASP